MEAIAVTALIGVLVSPVSWIHHYVVVVVASARSWPTDGPRAGWSSRRAPRRTSP